jgi:hypothetical protein
MTTGLKTLIFIVETTILTQLSRLLHSTNDGGGGGSTATNDGGGGWLNGHKQMRRFLRLLHKRRQ